MAYDKVIDSEVLNANLLSVANAIRKKGSTSDKLAFPAGFVEALNSMTIVSDNITIGENTVTPNFLNLFYALENNKAVTGEFTLADYLPDTETIIFDSGLSEINGFFYVDTDYAYTATGNAPEYGVWGLYMAHPTSKVGIDVTMRGDSTFKTNIGYNVSAEGPFARASSWRIDNGAIYIKAVYNRHSHYTPFCAGHRIKWVAW